MYSNDITLKAVRTVETAEKRGITLRVMGAVAFRYHCRRHVSLFDALEREITDMDLVAYHQQEREIERLLKDLGYEAHRGIFVTAYGGRSCFYDSARGLKVDVFFDQLSMCHTINLRNRLKLDYPTIPLADMLLEKLQIVKISEKDLKDVAILLLEHDLGESDDETINSRYISGLLSDDWGLYFTVTTNLKNLDAALSRYCHAFTDEQSALVTRRADNLLQAIDSQPKSLKWTLRAKVGPKKKWYADVMDESEYTQR